ncbi:hypothetical protein ACWCO3_31465, partial [Micromonospora sp. NPDC002411]
GSYIRTYGSLDLDAALLVLPLLGVDPTDSPRHQGRAANQWYERELRPTSNVHEPPLQER